MTESPINPEPAKRDPRALNAYQHGLTGQVASLAQSIADDRWRLLRAGAIDNSTFAIRLGGPDQFIANHEEIDAKPADAQAIAGGAQSRPPAGRGGSQSLVQLATSKGETHDIESDFPGEALPPQFDS